MFILEKIKLKTIFIIVFLLSLLSNGILYYSYLNKIEHIGKLKQGINECYDKLEEERAKCEAIIERLKIDLKRKNNICKELEKQNKKLQDKINEILNL